MRHKTHWYSSFFTLHSFTFHSSLFHFSLFHFSLFHFSLFTLSLFTLSLFTPAALAQEPPVITRTTYLAVGATRQQDTYLSPLDYSGTQFSLLSQSQRPVGLFHTHMQRQSLFQFDLHTSESPAANADYLGGSLRFDQSWYWTVASGEGGCLGPVQLRLGPQWGGTLGGLYNTRNGNNPAQLIADIHLGASAQAAFPFRLWKRPFALRLQADLPLLGLMFSPNYGQSYYELFSLGHTDHNVCLTHPLKAPTLRNRLTLDFRLGRHTFCAGYLMDVRQAHVNHLRRHQLTHAFLVGYTRHFTVFP